MPKLLRFWRHPVFLSVLCGERTFVVNELWPAIRTPLVPTSRKRRERWRIHIRPKFDLKTEALATAAAADRGRAT
jgi:hypothetical protein